MSVNSVSISGNLGRDARPLGASGMACTFSVAVSGRERSRETGQWQDSTTWVSCVLLGKRAQSLMPRLTKGTKVALSGRLRESSWERDGQRHTTLEVVVDEIEFLAPSSPSPRVLVQDPMPQSRVTRMVAEQQQADQRLPTAAYADSDIPF